MPPPRGNAATRHCFVDADLAGNTGTRRSQTGILIFVNRAPVIWYSKRQNTVEGILIFVNRAPIIWYSKRQNTVEVGHLEELLHIFGYLKQRPKGKLAFDPNHPMIDERRFKQYIWYNFYRDAEEAIPGDMPPPEAMLQQRILLLMRIWLEILEPDGARQVF